jgi:Mrp family chromosome partitioning ATPase
LDQLRIYSQEHEIVSVDANREILKDQIARVEQELALTESQLQQADAEIKDLRRKVEEVDAEVVNDKRSTADTTWSGMRTRMYDLELRERELSARFQGSHPELREVQQQLEEAGKILAQVGSERVDKSMTPNPAKLKLEGQLRGELTHVAGLKSKHAELVRQRKRMFGEVEKLLEHEIKMDELEREIGALRSAYAIHMTKLEEARVIEALEAKRISNISVFQPATFVERPAAPNKRLMGAAAIMLAIFGAAGAAYLAEWRNTTLYCPTQVEEALQTQVVATFPLVAVSPGSRGQADNIVLAELRSRCKPIVGELIFRQPENGGDGKKGLSLGVLSCGTGNGGSTVAAALALAASEDCQLSTVLVDSDLRSRFVSRAFQLNGAPGLYELSAKSAEISECVQTSGQRRLALISSSASTSESSATELDASIIACRLEELRPQHDLIVVDLPPASEAQQALTLAASLDRVLLVIEAETTERHQAEQIRAQLARAGKDVVGIVLNKTCDSMPRRSKLSV